MTKTISVPIASKMMSKNQIPEEADLIVLVKVNTWVPLRFAKLINGVPHCLGNKVLDLKQYEIFAQIDKSVVNVGNNLVNTFFKLDHLSIEKREILHKKLDAIGAKSSVGFSSVNGEHCVAATITEHLQINSCSKNSINYINTDNFKTINIEDYFDLSIEKPIKKENKNKINKYDTVEFKKIKEIAILKVMDNPAIEAEIHQYGGSIMFDANTANIYYCNEYDNIYYMRWNDKLKTFYHIEWQMGGLRHLDLIILEENEYKK